MRLMAVLSAAFLANISQAQSVTELTPSPTQRLASAPDVPISFVSSMKLAIGDWVLKPVYQAQDGVPHVVGLLATAPASGLLGSNLSVVYYSRPADDCDEWTAKTWTAGTAWDAVVYLKGEYGIPDLQDDYWEVNSKTVTAVASVEYAQGFVAGDAVGEAVNSTDADTRNTMVELLKGDGYAVADLPFEKSGGATAKGTLLAAAQFFDQAIGRNLTGSALSSLVASAYQPPVGLFDPTCELIQVCWNLWRCTHPATCEPSTIYGEWQPDGQVCNCTTTGPWSAVCGKFTADVRGKIKIHVPFPLPRGTEIEISASAGVTLNLCVCMWERQCTGAAVRSVTTINSDCSQSVSQEHKDSMTFSASGWRIASSADECQRAARPANIPPNDQQCGLQNDTP